jgi:excisionase family DNA binding protein
MHQTLELEVGAMQDDENKLMTTEEVAEELKVHVKTVRDWIASGELEAMDLGQGYRIWKSDLLKFLDSRRRRRADRKKRTDRDD